MFIKTNFNKSKSQKGITLTSLVIYVVALTIIMGVLTTITTTFFSNMGNVVDSPKEINEYNKFIMFFVTDIKNYNTATVTDSSVDFGNGEVVYVFRNNAIYRNDVQINKNVSNCKFTLSQYNVSDVVKNIINVDMKIGNNSEALEKNIDYTLRYW